ncbi:MAG: pyrroline-5-carboxylate reductase [Oscillospiraceae bacterium]|nr:pyrroline-5-carboxylate reductase [Oscillospiraceae bacterium]
MNPNTLGFIGLGNMGAALLRGFFKSKAAQEAKIYAYDPFSSSEKATMLDSEVEIAKHCKYVLLAVKPQIVGDVLTKIAPVLTDEHVLVSICAGISVDYIRARTSRGQKVVCVMPNTAAMIGYGASAMSDVDEISNEEREFVFEIFTAEESDGQFISADKMNEIICVNASSPAWIFLFAKCIADYADSQRIDRETAIQLFAQTLVGAGKMIQESKMTLDALIAQVTSPGGTTEAGLKALRENGFEAAIRAACEACTAKAYELGK